MFATAIVVTASIFGTLDSKPVCAPQTYYDQHVGRCSPCTDICLNPEIQGTEEQCKRKCPDFKTDGDNNKLSPGNSESTGSNVLAAAISTPVVAVIVIIAIFVALVKKREVKEFIYNLTVRNRDQDEEVAQNEETERKEPLVINNVAGSDLSGESSNDEDEGCSGDGRNTIESLEMFPTSDNKNFAQVTDQLHSGPYRPTITR